MKRRSRPRVKAGETLASLGRKGLFFNRGKQEVVDVLDIGPGGLSFLYYEPVPVGRRYDVVIHVPSRRSLRCVAKVRDVTETPEGLRVGVEFRKISREDADFLSGARLLENFEINVLDAGLGPGERLRAVRAAMGFTITELARLSGVPQQAILAMEVGLEDAPPSEETLSALARALGLDRSDLGTWRR